MKERRGQEGTGEPGAASFSTGRACGSVGCRWCRGARDRPDDRPASTRRRRDRGRTNRSGRHRRRAGRAGRDQRRPGGDRARLGIGQAACGLLAAGQVAAGLLGAVGQIALGPRALGMVQFPGAWVAIGWLLAALASWRDRPAPAAAGGAPVVPLADRDPLALERGTEEDLAHVAAPGHLGQSPARPALGFAMRLLAHGRGSPAERRHGTAAAR